MPELIMEADAPPVFGTPGNQKPPFIPGAQNVISTGRPRRKETDGAKGTILWVDDDSFYLDCGEKLLQILEYTPLMANSGAEALKLYARHQDDISLVILDMMMPHMNGHELSIRLAELNPRIKILVVTGYSDSELVKGLLQRKGVDFIQKPFALNMLSKKIEGLIRGRNTPPSSSGIFTDSI